VLLSVALATAACSHRASTLDARRSTLQPQTLAEKTNYLQTSRYSDVIAFLDSLQALGAPMARGTIGTSTQGREIPYVVLSRPKVSTPEEARRLGRPIVYVQGNIHAGEVEGKEALLALMRDLTFARGRNVLDSVVLVAVPIYNTDGNEKLAAQARNRNEQNGPELVGERPNGQGLDLNRDYVKAEAPETRGSLAMFDRWNPDVFVDLHTTDGSFHGYALTYSPSLNPAAPLHAFEHDTLLPLLRTRVRDRHGFETFPYGNFSNEYGADVNTDTTKQGWFTYEQKARYGSNYFGLRGPVSILSEAFSHDPFERRVKSTYAFVREILSLSAEQGLSWRARADAAARRDSAELLLPVARRTPQPLRSRMITDAPVGPVIAEDLARVADSALTQPGVPRGLRRTGRLRTVNIPIADRFTPTMERALPAGGYVLDASQGAAVRLLRLHGVPVYQLDEPLNVDAELFTVDSVITASRAFQGHHEVRLTGHWRTERWRVPVGSYLVPAGTRADLRAFQLLEPESDDGLATWNVFDAALKAGRDFPVVRTETRAPGARHRVP
jgi:hypothetical protein